MWLVVLFSLPIPFIGRTAIGWIVDITTIGATLLYGFVSAAAYKIARKEGVRRETVTGLAGFLIMLVFAVYLLFPNLYSDDPYAPFTPRGLQMLSDSIRSSFTDLDNPRPYSSLSSTLSTLLELVRAE